jgi:hypothetical protein
VYVPTVNTPSKKCPDLPYVDTDTNEAKCELNIAVYYYGIMSVNIKWKNYVAELEIIGKNLSLPRTARAHVLLDGDDTGE